MFLYIPALETRDAKQHQLEMTITPRRDVTPSSRGSRGRSYSDIAADVEPQSLSNSAAKPQSPSIMSLKLWENGDFSFGDIVDTINPLQHIPIVATIYRNMTGDKIGAVPRIVGGALWGRIGGFVLGFVNAIVDHITGKDIGDHIYAALFGDSGKSERETAIAQAAESVSGTVAAGLSAQNSLGLAPQVVADDSVATDSLVAFGKQERSPSHPLTLRNCIAFDIPTVVSRYARIVDWDESDIPLRFRRIA